MRDDNPVAGVSAPKAKGDGFQTWTEVQIAVFEARHPIGSRARLAFALLLYTAQRRGDVIRMGRQHIRNGLLAVRQNKTGTALQIPIHAALQVTPSDHLTFLTTSFGKPFTAPGSPLDQAVSCRSGQGPAGRRLIAQSRSRCAGPLLSPDRLLPRSLDQRATCFWRFEMRIPFARSDLDPAGQRPPRLAIGRAQLSPT
jgi:hypothetical protein